jgi:hypothetical protein
MCVFVCVCVCVYAVSGAILGYGFYVKCTLRQKYKLICS